MMIMMVMVVVQFTLQVTLQVLLGSVIGQALSCSWLGSRVVSRTGLRRGRARVQIAVATPSGNSLRQTAHIHRTSVHQAAKLAAALLRVAGVTAGLGL